MISKKRSSPKFVNFFLQLVFIVMHKKICVPQQFLATFLKFLILPKFVLSLSKNSGFGQIFFIVAARKNLILLKILKLGAPLPPAGTAMSILIFSIIMIKSSSRNNHHQYLSSRNNWEFYLLKL